MDANLLHVNIELNVMPLSAAEWQSSEPRLASAVLFAASMLSLTTCS